MRGNGPLMRSMRALRQRIFEARYVLAMVVILPIGSLMILPFADPITATKWYGLGLQIIGLGAVILGLQRLRRHFDKPSLGAVTREWLSRWREVFGRPRTIHAAVGAALESDTAFGIGHVRSSVPPGATLEQQLDVVRREIDSLFRSIDQIWKHHHELSTDFNNSLKEQRASSEAAIAQLRSHHEQAAIGDFGMEMTGVFFVLFGVVLATVPEWASDYLQCFGSAMVSPFASLIRSLS